ncbi:MAG: flagellar biosynthetic protein FliO [Treponema sp.]|nr:flagellar biosynthetic protein FliO [Spirochaetales bacterium]MDY6189134.1 flagellar biosynthetic protein FliO [Treponema sp.]
MGKSIKSLLTVVFLLLSFSVLNAQQSTSTNQKDNVVSEQSIILNPQTDAVSQENANDEYKPASTIGVFVRMIIVLIVVVLLIYAFFWFVKRKTNNNLKTDDDYLRRVAYLNIAPGKTVEVITLIDKAYLIGVTEDNINLLGEIDDKELITAMNLNSDKKANIKKPATFNEVLELFLQKGSKKKSVFSQEESKVENLFSENPSKQDDTL